MKQSNLSFKLIYILFSILFVLASILFAVIFSFEDQSLFAISFYVLTVFVIAIFFVLTIGKKVKAIVQRLDNMVEKAINHEDLQLGYDETTLSVLENKLNRFLSMSKAILSKREEEKNTIKSLISDISHQTKTPISNILLYSQLLQECEEGNCQSKEFINEITAQSEKLSFLIETLVKMSRLETGIINAKSQVSSINKLLENVINAIENKASLKNISINLQCKDEVQGFFDSKWMEEAIYNIVDNAVKYTPIGGKVTISVNQYEMFTNINISDTGIGINEKEINNIFKRFYRSSDVSQYEGIGIGLFLAREIITFQGGYIKVKSEPKVGSIFSVFIPNIR
ncbi:HAMP domain-containing sensor histidine kinase [Clostridium sp. JN-1]|uniref:sensor histidine kinase n=1 Tax=Clostridium sp. JN-1 TaxID=2483110 RepID=UPI000F0AFAEF|nr:HAMP domain-containing sensor histidine kinase [Clostridium sp. JN-1]